MLHMLETFTREKLHQLRSQRRNEEIKKLVSETCLHIYRSVMVKAELGETLAVYKLNTLGKWGDGTFDLPKQTDPEFLNQVLEKLKEIFTDSRVECKACFNAQDGKIIELEGQQPHIVFQDKRFFQCIVVDWKM